MARHGSRTPIAAQPFSISRDFQCGRRPVRHHPAAAWSEKFDHVITAQQAGAYKPSLKIFELALSRIGIPANRILHVGQSIYHDVIPAQSLGLGHCLGEPPFAASRSGRSEISQGRPDLEVSSLADLAAASAR